MDLQYTGTIEIIYAAAQISEKFKTQNFVVKAVTKLQSGEELTIYANFQCINAACLLLDMYSKGDKVTVTFKIKGTRSETNGQINYFNNMHVYRIAGQSAG